MSPLRHLVPVLGLLLVLAPPLAAQRDSVVALEGAVRDTVSGVPVAFAAVRVAGTARSALTARDGSYRIAVPPGRWVLEFRKIGYRMASLEVDVPTDRRGVDVVMRPVPVELAAVTVTDEYVNPAHAIIRGAIARKNDLLARIHDYRYDAYVKLVARDLGKPPDSAAAIVLITETRTTAYWQRPDRYQEVITARRQSSNLSAERNLVTVGQIVNFNRDRIDVGRYSVVSPTADDALAFYDYHVIDTLWDGGTLVFRLAVEPRSATRPLFVGYLDVADATFDVRAIDVGANEAMQFPLFSRLRYRQRLAPVLEDAWMPAEIRFSGELHVGVPIPGFPNHVAFEHSALLEHFRFDQGDIPGTLGEYLVVVDDGADRADSAQWAERRPVPLSEVEAAAWSRIDSVERAPPSFGKVLLGGTLRAVSLATNEDFFHFNRVEGPYLGAGITWRGLAPWLVLRAATGYAFEREDWQHEYGASVRLSERQRLWIGGTYRERVVPRPSVITAGRNTTIAALWDKEDPRDYYAERGFVASVQTKVVAFVGLRLDYLDFEHRSAPVASNYSLFDRDTPAHPNPPIVEGRLRSLAATLTYDSRPRLKSGGRDFVFQALAYTHVTLGTEYAAPELIANDFDFFRVYLRVARRQPVGNLGLTTIDAMLGGSTGDLPPQRYFTVDFARSSFLYLEDGFNTLQETNFSGNRLAMLRARHDFGRQVFRRLPLLRVLPLTFSVQGGVFWTDFVDHTPNPGDETVRTAPSPYGEVGFGIGNLTPWLAPLNLGVWLLWQVSSYDTERFAVALEVPRVF